MKSDLTIKIDLHTHSILSYDGGISEDWYEKILDKTLTAVAITDHNTIDFALSMKKKFGQRIIVGEEIMSSDGEIIGLFLSKPVPSAMSFQKTVEYIKKQDGIVYIPHPFEYARHSVSVAMVQDNLKDIDILETFNARSLGRKKHSPDWETIRKATVAYAASSDAHCRLGIGSAYSMIKQMPTRQTLVTLLNEGFLTCSYAPILSYLCPGINKLRRMFAYA